MSWSELKRHVDPALFLQMRPDRILYDFDGPQIFTFCGSFGQQLLAYLCSDLGDRERFIVVPITDVQLGELERGELAVRDLLTSSWIWIVDRSYAGDVLNAWAVDEATLPRDVLPEPGIMLAPPSEEELDDVLSSVDSSVFTNYFIELKVEPQSRLSILTNDLIIPSLRACTEFLKSAFMRFFNVQPLLVFASARTGSFVIRDELFAASDVAEQLPVVFQMLNKEARSGPGSDGCESWRRLLNVLRENKVRLEINAFRGNQQLESLELGISRQKELRHLILEFQCNTSIDRRNIVVDSLDVPQADDLIRVFQVVELRSTGRPVTPESLGGITPRQVSYYRRAANLLGFLDDEGALTPGGKIFGRLPDEDQLRTCVVHFESSTCGEAWIRWSGGRTLLDVAPESAAEFLRNCSIGLSEDTQLRRAKTLSSWHELLIPHHYAHMRS